MECGVSSGKNSVRSAAEFDKVFKELFGGGTGTLELIAGRRYPGGRHPDHFPAAGQKAPEHDAALRWRESTDGDRLLFAIQNLKPSPFCLLR